MSMKAKYVMSGLIVAMLVGGPIAWSRYLDHNYRNFKVVQDRVLYRSGQLSINGLAHVVHDYGIRTVVTLRDTGDKADLAEEAYCRKQGINFYRIPPRPYSAADGSVPAEQGVKEFLSVMDDPSNYPVLVHCFAGVHRTGSFCAVYRMEHQGWPNARAIAEVRDIGYEHLDDEMDVLSFLEDYRAGRLRRAPVVNEKKCDCQPGCGCCED